MHQRARNILIFVAGGLAGVVIAVPAAALAAPSANPPSPRPAVSTTSGEHSGHTGNHGALTRGQVNRMMDQCGQVMRSPQMQQLRKGMMNRHTGGSMMGDSSPGGSMMGGSMMGSSR